MDQKFDEFETYLIGFRAICEALEDTQEGEALAEIVEAYAGGLIFARNAHIVGIWDDPFLLPLLEDIPMSRIVEAIGRCSIDVREKFLMVAVELMKDNR